MAIVTATDVLDHHTAIDSTANDALLGRLITRSDALCAHLCGWPANDAGAYTFEQSQYTVYPRPLPSDPRALGHGFPWIASSGDLTSIHVDDDRAYGASSEVDAADVEIDNARRLLLLKPSSTAEWSQEDRANKLVVDAGYVATPSGGRSTAPPELVAIVCTMVRILWDRAQVEGRSSISFDAGSVSRPDEDIAILVPRALRDALIPFTFGVKPTRRLGPYMQWGIRG